METKVCSKCSIEKSLLDYNVCSRVKDGRKAECRECQRLGTKEYKLKNKEKIKEYNSKWNAENKFYYQEYRKIWEVENYDKVLETRKRFKEKNPGYINDYNKQRKKKDILFRIISDMRNSVNRYLKYKSKSTFDIVGCTPELLKEHLEKQFTDGMTWENRNKWHIDHVVPLSSAKTEDELYKLCHYTNLQPLWAEDNLRKSNKVFTI
jgi:hypothetical protein